MKLSIRTRSIDITDDLRDLVSRRLRFALDVFGERVRSASVYLVDVNGPRGGVDKSCQIAATVRGAGEILVTGSGSTPSEALTQAARRLKYRISESLRHTQRPTPESIRRMTAAA